MKRALKEDLQRSYELIYGKQILEQDKGLIDKLKDTASKIFGKKEEIPPTPAQPQGPRLTRAPSNATPDFIPEPLKIPTPPQARIPMLPGKGFTHLNLTKSQDYTIYSEICQTFINKRNPRAGINGNMLALAAKNTYQTTKKYIPPELSLAQLALEGGLSKDPKAKPIRTNNPFNVANYDNGKITSFRTKQDGINRYYSLIANDYLGDGKDIVHLAQNFTNKHGNRYATAPDYESKLNQIMRDVHNISQSIVSSYSS